MEFRRKSVDFCKSVSPGEGYNKAMLKHNSLGIRAVYGIYWAGRIVIIPTFKKSVWAVATNDWCKLFFFFFF